MCQTCQGGWFFAALITSSGSSSRRYSSSSERLSGVMYVSPSLNNDVHHTPYIEHERDDKTGSLGLSTWGKLVAGT